MSLLSRTWRLPVLTISLWSIALAGGCTWSTGAAPETGQPQGAAAPWAGMLSTAPPLVPDVWDQIKAPRKPRIAKSTRAIPTAATAAAQPPSEKIAAAPAPRTPSNQTAAAPAPQTPSDEIAAAPAPRTHTKLTAAPLSGPAPSRPAAAAGEGQGPARFATIAHFASDKRDAAAAPIVAEAPSQPGVLVTPQEAKCEAAHHSPFARLVIQEREAAQQKAGDRKRLRKAVALHDAVSRCRELDERNKSASTTLLLYYRLAEVAAQGPVAAGVQSELDSLTETTEKLRESGLPIKTDRTDIRRQRLAADDQESDLHFGALRLSRQINLLMGRGGQAPPITPYCQLAADRNDVAVEAAVKVGLGCRPDLNMLRLLINNLDEDTLQLARQALGGSSSGLGMVLESKCGDCFSCVKCLLPDCNGKDCCELAKRKAQLCQLYQATLERAEAEIVDAALAINQRLQNLANAESTERSWRLRIEQLEAQGGAGVYLLRVEASFSLLKARAVTLHHAASLESERVTLRMAQGVLARECGYGCCCDGNCRFDAPSHDAPSYYDAPLHHSAGGNTGAGSTPGGTARGNTAGGTARGNTARGNTAAGIEPRVGSPLIPSAPADDATGARSAPRPLLGSPGPFRTASQRSLRDSSAELVPRPIRTATPAIDERAPPAAASVRLAAPTRPAANSAAAAASSAAATQRATSGAAATPSEAPAAPRLISHLLRRGKPESNAAATQPGAGASPAESPSAALRRELPPNHLQLRASDSLWR